MDVAEARSFLRVGKKVRIYRGHLYGCDLYVLGDYGPGCGGCDTIQPFDMIIPYMKDIFQLSENPTLLVYEGLLISHSIGSIGEFVKPMGRRHIMAFLDTSLNTCLERVRERRREKGNLTPLDPANTIKDHASVGRCAFRAVDQGFRVEILPHKDAIARSLELLHELSRLVHPALLDQGTGGNTGKEGSGGTAPLDDRPNPA
jgi:hypothetical protein